MNEKDKARNLTDTMFKKVWDERGIKLGIDELKVCALIAVDEIIKENDMFDRTDGYVQQRIDYWNEVKQEIDNL